MHERDIFLAALQITDESARSRYAIEACGDDIALYNRVELLLANYAKAGSFMEQRPLKDSQKNPGCAIPTPGDGNTLDFSPASNSFSPGEILTCIGEYQILGEIARGGMGIVFRAKHVRLRRDVALKVILNHAFTDPLNSKRFEREAQLAAGLQHPNIVRVFEFDEHKGFRYLTMEYVEGNDLGFELRKGPFAPKRAADLVLQVAKAVQYAHDQGVCHRDLKPANILLDKEGRPFVSDFGLAKEFIEDVSSAKTELTQTGQILGTPGFMSPEQAAGKPEQVLPASDIYSLGAILYSLLVGHSPFSAATPIETLHQVIHQEPVAPRTLNLKIPRDLETICLKCLRKNAKNRYASAGELAEDLSRWLEGKAIRARAIGLWERSWKWTRKHPAGAAIVLVMLLATVLTSWLWRQAAFASRTAAVELYFNRIALAERGLAAGNRNDAILPLLECSEEERGWEWKFFNALCYDTPHIKLSVDSQQIRRVKFDPSGRFLGSVENDKVRIWDAVGFGLLCSIGVSANAIEFSADGSLAVLAIGGEVKSFSTLTGQVVKTLYAGADDILGICIDDNNHFLAVLDKKKRVTLCQFSDGKIVGAVKVDSENTDATWVADLPATFRFIQQTSNLLVPTAGLKAEIWDTINVKKLQSIDQPDETYSNNGPTIRIGDSLRCTDSRGQLFAYGSSSNGWETKLVDLKKHAFVAFESPFRAETITMALDPRGGFAALARYRTAAEQEDFMIEHFRTSRERRDSQWYQSIVQTQSTRDATMYAIDLELQRFQSIVQTHSTRDGVLIREYRNHAGRIDSLAIRPDSRRMASVGTYFLPAPLVSKKPDQPPIGEFNVWDVEDSSPSMALEGHRSAITHVCISPFGEIIASVDESCEVRIWKSTGQLLRVLQLHEYNEVNGYKVRGMAFTSNGSLVFAIHNRIQWWNVETARLDSEIRGDFAWMVGDASGNRIAYQSSKSGIEHVYVVSATTREQVYDRQLEMPIAPQFNSAGRLWGLDDSAGMDRLTLFEPFGNKANNARLEQASNLRIATWSGGITDTALSADGQFLAASGDLKRVLIWNARNGRQVADLSCSGESLAFVADGSRLAYSSDDKILICQTTDGRRTCVLHGHTRRINDIAFSHDGKFLVSGGTDKSVRIWGTAHLIEARFIDESSTSPSPPPSLPAFSDELDVCSQWYLLCNPAMTKATREYERDIQTMALNSILNLELRAAKPYAITQEDELRKRVATGMANVRERVVEANRQSDAPLPKEFVSHALDDLLNRRIDRAILQLKSLPDKRSH